MARNACTEDIYVVLTLTQKKRLTNLHACILLLAVNQSLFLVVAERFDAAFSFHSLAAAAELLYVYHLLSFMNSCISGALALLVLFNPVFQILGVSRVIAAVFAKKDVDIVRHRPSTHGCYELTLLF
jgi:hypothetical protein